MEKRISIYCQGDVSTPIGKFLSTPSTRNIKILNRSLLLIYTIATIHSFKNSEYSPKSFGFSSRNSLRIVKNYDKILEFLEQTALVDFITLSVPRPPYSLLNAFVVY